MSLDMKVLDYRITSDSNQVIVSKVRRNEQKEISMIENKDGDLIENTNVIGYYSNVSKALSGVQRNYLLGSDEKITDLITYKKALDSITKEFESKLRLGEEF